MEELGFDITNAIAWFPHEIESPYILVPISEEHASAWPHSICDVLRRCYLSDELLRTRSLELELELKEPIETCRAKLIGSKLPDAGSTMAGDFGEILTYLYQSAKAHPLTAFGPKKWRLKQDRSKPAPYSDVVQFILPTWPTPSANDEILCAEVKTKSTDGTSSPITGAINDCLKDRTSRLSKTLVWLKDRAISENLGMVRIEHLERFINGIDYPPYAKRFRAVAVICSNLVDAELVEAPATPSSEYTLVVISVPNLRDVYTRLFNAGYGIAAATGEEE